MKAIIRLSEIALVITVLSISTNSVADIYRWVDKETGEIFFSETPPPPEVTRDYTNITSELEKRILKRQQATTARATSSSQTQPKNTNQITLESSGIISDQALLSQRRCKSFNEQITRLEKQISQTEDPNIMDRLVIKLDEYEQSLAANCSAK